MEGTECLAFPPELWRACPLLLGASLHVQASPAFQSSLHGIASCSPLDGIACSTSKDSMWGAALSVLARLCGNTKAVHIGHSAVSPTTLHVDLSIRERSFTLHKVLFTMRGAPP